MDRDNFAKPAHQLIDWIEDYWKNVEDYPLVSKVKPGEVYKMLPSSPPVEARPFDEVFKEFQHTIMPGITHWQHPSFFAFFPPTASPASFLGEVLMAGLSVHSMLWQTSPSATELEERVMEWLREMIGLSSDWTGVLQDTASSCGLLAFTMAREKQTGFRINEGGFDGSENFRLYTSEQAHSSIEKDVKIAGFGKKNLRYIETDNRFAMNLQKLREAIERDIANGKTPLAIIATLGTTSSCAVDPLKEIGRIAREKNIWLHVDAAYCGAAMILPELRGFLEGVEQADSFVFNPHKWLYTHFDCSAFFIKDPKLLTNCLEISPEYLKTQEDAAVKNYRDWQLQLGRRFRALKVWMVLNLYGQKGLQDRIRKHIELGKLFASLVEEDPNFEIMAPVDFNLVCFRYHPQGVDDEDELEKLNSHIKDTVNQSGKAYMVHTKLNGSYVLRICPGQTYVEERHVRAVWNQISTVHQAKLA